MGTATLTTRDAPAPDGTIRQQAGPSAQQITVGLVNNMPDAAIRATERQFGTLLRLDGLDVRLRFFHLPQVVRSPSARTTFLASYHGVEELRASGVDGLIVTGAEPRAPRLREEPYWQALTELIDWAEDNTISSIWSCLAAHAAVLHLDGVERRPLPKKLFGVFECSKAAEHCMLADAPRQWPVPHSRLNDLDRAELAARDYVVLSSSPIAGADTFLKQRNSLFVFFQGHLEYESQTLLREYIRDITRFINGERDSYPDMPHGYFSAAMAAELERIRNKALADRSAEILAAVAESPVAQSLTNTWRGSAANIYGNWLRYLADEKRRRGGGH
jgi:homoserine O-succinyltransferase/O-acetyltransferase